MRRVWMTLGVGLLLLAGCGPSYDEEGFDLVLEYADAQIAAVEGAALIDPDGDGQRAEAADRIDQANADYWGRDDWPDADEVKGWNLNRTQGDRTWQVEGEELWAAVSDLEDTSGWLAEQLRGDDDQELDWAWEDATDAVANLRSVLNGRS